MPNTLSIEANKLITKIKRVKCEPVTVDLLTRSIASKPKLLSTLITSLEKKKSQKKNFALYQVAVTIGSLPNSSMHNELWNCFAKSKKLDDLCLYLLMMPRPYALTLLKCKNKHIKKTCITFLCELSQLLLIIGGSKKSTNNNIILFSFGLGDIGNALKDVYDTVADFAEESIKNFVELIEEGLMTLTDIMKELVNESFDQIKDCIRALISAQNKITDILSNAAINGIDFLKQTVKAIVEVSDKINDILIWAANQIPYVGPVLTTLIECNILLVDILASALTVSLQLFKEMVNVAITLFEGLSNFLYQVANASIETLRSTMLALIEASHDIAEILVNMCADVITDIMRGNLLQALLDIGNAIKDILTTALDAGLAAFIAIIAGFIALWGGRPLTYEELFEARLVFGSWDKLDTVLVAFNTLPSEFCEWIDQHRPFTTLYIINFPNTGYYNLPTIIHELVHVWQNYIQDGALYMVDSIENQLRNGTQAAYDYDPDTDLVADATNWSNFNVEQQAEIIEDYYKYRFYDLVPAAEYQIYLPYAQKVYSPPPDFNDLETIAEARRQQANYIAVTQAKMRFRTKLNAWFRYRQYPQIRMPGGGIHGIPEPRPHR